MANGPWRVLHYHRIRVCSGLGGLGALSTCRAFRRQAFPGLITAAAGLPCMRVCMHGMLHAQQLLTAQASGHGTRACMNERARACGGRPAIYHHHTCGALDHHNTVPVLCLSVCVYATPQARALRIRSQISCCTSCAAST